MNKLIIHLGFLALGAALAGCASSYRQLNPHGLYYKNSDTEERVTLSYKYNILNEVGNRKYSNRESKKGIKLVALKIKNDSESELTLGQNLILYTGNQPAAIVEPQLAYKELKQPVAPYLFYLLLSPLQLYTTDGYEVKSTPIGLVLGPGLTAGNMLGASGANANFKTELFSNYLLNKTVKPGETMEGLVAIYDLNFNPLKVKVQKAAVQVDE